MKKAKKKSKPVKKIKRPSLRVRQASWRTKQSRNGIASVLPSAIPRNDQSLSGRDLTKAQNEAAEPSEKNVLVSAGAGTGKTSVLVERYLRLIAYGLARPNEILAITFMEKAANEMKKRVVDGLRSLGLGQARREIENAYIGTIHAFCARLLREHPLEAGIDPDFRVLEKDEEDLMKRTALLELMEDRFTEPAVAELLGVYGEECIRKGLEAVDEKMRTYGLSMESLSPAADPSRADLVRETLLEKLRALTTFPKKREKAEALIEFLHVPLADGWLGIQAFREAGKLLDLRAKDAKEETKEAKALFESLRAFQIETLNAPFRQTFLELLREFKIRYESAKRERAGFDFTDLQLKAIELLSSTGGTSQAIRERYRLQFKFIMVDEFQDTDPVQVRLLDLLRRENNLFLVGDFKQSIYGFRGSEPKFFAEKEKEFKDADASERMSLQENFRSRSELLDFINPFFETLWKGNDPPYEPLLAKSNFKERFQAPVEFILIEKEKGEKLKLARPEEARQVAERIQELVEKEGCRYGDFAILFRAGETMNFYEQELRALDIPYYVLGGIGFYNRPEVRDLTNFLLALENPMRDIPFAALMRSPMFSVSDDALFWICRHAKKEKKAKPIFSQLIHLEEVTEISEEDKKRLTRFQSIFESCLSLKGNRTVADMLEHILEVSGYDLYVLGSSQGKRRFANIRKLIDLAREIEARDAAHFGDFVRYVKGLEAEEVRESEAQVEAEDDDVVKLLTIHKAKGLEFKCVIVPDLGRGKSKPEQGFLVDPKLGFGMKAFNTEEDDWEETLTQKLISEAWEKRQTEESKRLLYVAMTRAKERLILAGIAETGREAKEDSEGWLDWVRLAIDARGLKVKRFVSDIHPRRSHKPKLPLAQKKNFREKIKNLEPLRMKRPPAEAEMFLGQLRPHKGVFFDRLDLPVSAYLLFAKEETHEAYKRVYELGVPDRPLEVKEEAAPLDEIEDVVSAADIGTLVHQVFEHFVRKSRRESIRGMDVQETVRFYTQDVPVLSDEVGRMAETFVRSRLFQDLARAKRVFTELPFSLRLKHGIVHGILDLLFQDTDGRWVIADYKTSNIKKFEAEATGERYREQMELYALASAKILRKMPEKAVLYFVRPDETYEIKFKDPDERRLRECYEKLQEAILQFRKELVDEPS